jgi:hypothetical protein
MRTHRVTVVELVLVCSLLFVVLLFFFADAIPADRVLSSADGIFSTSVFAEQAPSGFSRPSNHLLFDQVYQFTPWRLLSWNSLRQGELPLWNPYSSSGTPFVATMQSAVLYPINLMLTAVPFERTFVWSAILRLWIAGICTYLLARHYRLDKLASLVASIAFMLSGFLIGWLGHPHTNVAVWLPALVLLAELLVSADTGTRIVRSIAVLGVIVGIQFTGGHIETSSDLLFAFTLYYVIRWFQIRWPIRTSLGTELRRTLLYPTLAVLMGATLAAAQLLPFLQWMYSSSVFAARVSSSFQLIDPVFIRHLLSLPLVLFPNLFNNPTWDAPYWSFLMNWGNYLELVTYTGTLTLLLALVAMLMGRQPNKALVVTWMIIGIVCLGRAFHLPVFDWINQLPGFSLATPSRLRLVASLSICILAAFGVHTLRDVAATRHATAAKLWTRLCAGVVALGIAIMLVSNVVLPLVRDRVTAYGRQMVEREYASRETHSNTLEYYYAEVDQMVEGLQAAFRPRNLAMYTPILWASLGLALPVLSAQFRLRRSTALGVALVSVVVADLYTFGHGFNPSIPVNEFYPTPTAIAEVNSHHGLYRTTALRQDLVPDAHMMFGLSDFRGLDFPTKHYAEYLNLIPSRIPWLSYGSIFASVDSPLLRLLNLRYVMAADSTPLRQDPHVVGLRKIGQVYLAEIDKPVPRAFMVYETAVVREDDVAGRLLQSAPGRSSNE